MQTTMKSVVQSDAGMLLKNAPVFATKIQ